MFNYSTPVKLHHIDAAGMMFFAQFFYLAHDGYEAFLAEISFDLRRVLQEDFLIPLAHAEADYKLPVKIGDELTFEIRVDRIGETSFTLSYRVVNQKGEAVAALKTIHTTLSKSTRQPIPLPPELKEALQRYTAR
jgi:YbgC/YbaW family acyl-CoA thioester hydrolase